MEAIQNIIDLQFWVKTLIPISVLMMPILLVGKAPPFRAFLAAVVIYIMLIVIAYPNVPNTLP